MQILVCGINMVFCVICLHGIVANRPKRQVAEAGSLVCTCTVTVFSATCGVLFVKLTSRGSDGGGVVTTGGASVDGSGVAVPVKRMINVHSAT